MIRLWLSCILIGFSVFANCDLACAEERLVAVILVKNQPRYQNVHLEFEKNLSQINTQEFRLYVQSPNADLMSLRNSARKAIAIGADLIVAYGTQAAIAAQAETIGTPVLFADVYDPFRQGLVNSEGGPVRYTVGVRGDGPIQTLLRVFLEATHSEKIGILFDPHDPAGLAQADAIVSMGGKKQLQLIRIPVVRSSNLLDALANVPDSIEGLFVTDSAVLSSHLAGIINFSNKRNIPAVSQIPGFADLGGFMSLENDPNEQGKVLAGLVREVMSGKEVKQMAMIHPRQVALTINLKVAQQLGIKVPFEVLTMTSRVIR